MMMMMMIVAVVVVVVVVVNVVVVMAVIKAIAVPSLIMSKDSGMITFFCLYSNIGAIFLPGI